MAAEGYLKNRTLSLNRSCLVGEKHLQDARDGPSMETARQIRQGIHAVHQIYRPILAPFQAEVEKAIHPMIQSF